MRALLFQPGLLLTAALVAGRVLAAPPAASASPETLVLGGEATVSVHVKTEGSSALLRGAAQVGELSAGELVSEHEARFSWRPPSTSYPQVALLLFWSAGGDGPPEVTVLRLPLHGKTVLEAVTEPRAQVRVEVAGTIFGPVRANERGHAGVPIEVPPGVRAAQVLARAGNQSTTASVSLDVPPFNPLAALISPDPLHAESGGWLWVFHSNVLDAGALQVEVEGGKATLLGAAPDRALFKLIPAPEARELITTASLRGRREARATATVSVSSGPAPAPAPPSPSSAPPPRLSRQRWVPEAHLGGYFAGGANTGLELRLGIGYLLPVLGDRLMAELGTGVRMGSLTTSVPGLGALYSRLLCMPIDLSARLRAASIGPWVADVRLGGGLLPFRHQVQSSFQATFTEWGLGVEAFAALQGTYRVGALEMFVEVRGSLSPLQTGIMNAQLGGLVLAFGGRHAP